REAGRFEFTNLGEFDKQSPKGFQHTQFKMLLVTRGLLDDNKISLGRAVYALFETFSEAFLVQPTIIYDYPTEVSPLSKQKPDDPDHVERFEIFAGGFEIGNAFS